MIALLFRPRWMPPLKQAEALPYSPPECFMS
jgi:hypothetical protein